MIARLQARLRRWERRMSRSGWMAASLNLSPPQETQHEPGLLLVQVDGLSREQFERALKRGRLPFLRGLLRHRGYATHTFYSGQPSTTPAVQGELYYGIPTAVPAFSFLDRAAGKIGLMMFPEWAKRVEARLADSADGLLRGGSSWGNIYTGGATQQESHFCGASFGLGDMWKSIRLRTLAVACVLYFPVILRLFGLLLLEIVLGIRDVFRGIANGRHPLNELKFLFARVLVCVGLREVVTMGGALDLHRGLPVVHVNFLGYDEQSHRRGPDSEFAHWTLRGIDRSIRRLHRAARLSTRRDYEVWIFSDHGQARVKQARHLVDGGLEGLVRKHWIRVSSKSEDTAAARPARHRPSPGHWSGGHHMGGHEVRRAPESAMAAFEKDEFAVAALGPVGHIYFGAPLGRDAARQLAARLVSDGIPGVLMKRDDGSIDWITASGEHVMPEHSEILPHEPGLRETVAHDLVKLCQHPDAGDIIALGFGLNGERWTFAEENGAHAGPSPEEVQGFALLPRSTWLPDGTQRFIRPAALREAALHVIGEDRRSAPRLKGAARPRKRTEHLRVVTYNTHGCYGTDGLVRPERIARVLEACEPDIAALQEIDVGRRRSRGEDQLRKIADALGMHHQFFPSIENGSERYGHGILSRSPFTVRRHGFLPTRRSGLGEPRSAAWVTIDLETGPVHVVATHLGLGVEERQVQVADLLGNRWLGAIDPAEPVILCGDLNLSPGFSGYRMIARRYRDVQAHAPSHVAQRTFPSLYPLRRLDHIFVSEHFDVESVDVPRDFRTVVASDHLPVVAELAFSGAKVQQELLSATSVGAS